MKEIIITVLGVLLVLLIGVGIYFAFFNGANDMGQNAVSQQGKLQQMTSDSDTVAGNMVKDYAERADGIANGSGGSPADSAFFTDVFDNNTNPDLSGNAFENLAIGVRIQESGSKKVLTDLNSIQSEVNNNGVYEVRKYYDSNGDLYVVLFDQNDLSD